MSLDDEWPSLALGEWLSTYATLHRWVQIVGKTRLVLAPFENHWWHCALYVSARCLTTSAMPFGDGDVESEFDFPSDELALRARYDSTMREWILPYGAVRASSDPHRLIAAFLESTYAAAASLGKWNVDALRASGRARELERMDGSTQAE